MCIKVYRYIRCIDMLGMMVALAYAIISTFRNLKIAKFLSLKSFSTFVNEKSV